jgi:hypothetical protein
MTPEKAHTFMPFTYLCHNLRYLYNNNNNNQAFYSQASWGMLEMKSHEPKKGTKQERKRGKQRAIKTK